MPTKGIMDTKLSVAVEGRRRGPYQRHSLDFKRSVVEETLVPGASVARIARIHGLNASQVFAWRKAYREGALVATEQALPVEVADCRRKIVGPVPLRDTAHLPQRRLQPLRQGLEALGETYPDRLDVRVGEHQVENQVGKRRAGEGDLQGVHRAEVGLRHAARHMLLREHHLLFRSLLHPPSLDVPLWSPTG